MLPHSQKYKNLERKCFVCLFAFDCFRASNVCSIAQSLYLYMEAVTHDQSKAMEQTWTYLFSFENEKKKLLRWDSNPWHIVYEAHALPTELMRQLSLAGYPYVHV